MSLEKLESEARAKITWGEPPEDVIKHLTTYGVDEAEAAKITGYLCQERKRSIQALGRKKIFQGCLLIPVPFIAWIIHIREIKLFGTTIAIGVYGVYKVLTGVLHILYPHMEQGDLSNHDL